MAEIINLRRARKAKEREADATKASENRARFGRTKAEKEIDKAQKLRADRLLDGHERDKE